MTRLVEKAGVLSLSAQRQECPYSYVTVQGTVFGEDRPPFAARRGHAALDRTLQSLFKKLLILKAQ
jgi:hypothetical protein